jgi:sarcosine oxidase subunit beta
VNDVAADVVIVGGGIMGAATALFLRRRGRSVILLERDLVGQYASGTNFGNVRRQGRVVPELPLATRSLEIWNRLRDLIGEDAEFEPTGHLRVCFTREEVDRYEAYARDAKDCGLDIELMSRNALRARFPYLSPDLLFGSLSLHDGQANPRLAAPALARAAARSGATVCENVEVETIEKSGDDFRVETRAGIRLRAPAVLLSAGAWSARFAAAFGEPLNLAVRGPQMTVTEPVPYAIEPTMDVTSRVATESIYWRQVRRGNIVVGGGMRGPAHADTRRAYINPASTLNQMTHLRRVVPALASVSVIRTWSGIESYTDDDLAVIGPSPTVAGLYYAFGFCGSGFALGPGVGDVMAELIDTGRTATPIERYGIGRFASPASTPAFRPGSGH